MNIDLLLMLRNGPLPGVVVISKRVVHQHSLLDLLLELHLLQELLLLRGEITGSGETRLDNGGV